MFSASSTIENTFHRRRFVFAKSALVNKWYLKFNRLRYSYPSIRGRALQTMANIGSQGPKRPALGSGRRRSRPPSPRCAPRSRRSRSRREVAEPFPAEERDRRARRVVANFWQKFGKMLLVFGCIGTDFCKKICVLQHFSKSTRLSS